MPRWPRSRGAGRRLTTDRPVLLLLILGLLASLSTMVLLARSIAAPTAPIRDVVRSVSRGELHTDLPVPVTDAGEIGQLQHAVNDMVAGLRESERLHDLFGRQVGPDVARRPLARGVELGGESRYVAVLFVDLDGSTTFAGVGSVRFAAVAAARPRLKDGAVSNRPSSGYVANDLLSRLVGCRLYSVQFVMDYVQLRFDGPTRDEPVLNCDVMPAVELGAGIVVDGQIGYGDALRSLIPRVVRQTCEETGIGLRIEFDNAAIVVHPAREDLMGPEIALLWGFEDRRWMCWRPGEESFEDLA